MISLPKQFSHMWIKMEFLVAQMVKSLPAMQETQVQSLSREDPLEKEMATHSSILENPMDGEAWQATVHRVTKGWTRLSTYTFTCMTIKMGHILMKE